MVDYKKWFWYGVVIGILLPIFTSIIAKLIPAITLQFSVLPATTVTPSFPSTTSNFFLAIASNAANFPQYLISAIGAAIFVLLGVFVFSRYPRGKNAFTKMFMILLYASIALALLIWFTSGAALAFPVIFLSILNSLVIAGIAYVLDKIGLVEIPSV